MIYWRSLGHVVLYGAIFLAALLLTGCSRQDNNDQEREQFVISTITFGDLTERYAFEKQWRIVGQETITVTSKVAGRVEALVLWLGDALEEGDVVIELNDTLGSARAAFERARSGLLSAQSTYETTRANLDKSLTDSFASYQFAVSQLAQAQRDAEAQQQQIMLDASSNRLDNPSSLANLQLEALDTQITNARFELATKKTADQETLEWFLVSYTNLTRDVAVLFEEVTSALDQVFGVSSLYSQSAQVFRPYLAARNTALYTQARDLLTRSLRFLSDVQEDAGRQSTPDDLADDLRALQSSVDQLRELLEVTRQVLSASVTGPEFTQWQLDGLRSQVSGLQAQAQWYATSIVQQKNWITAFLSTYLLQQESIENNIRALEQQRDTTRASLEVAEETIRIASERQQLGISTSVASAQLQATTAESSYAVVRDTKDATLAWLNASLITAQAAYDEAQAQLAQFSVASPIGGVVDSILVERGADVSPWTPLFVVSNNQQPQITLSLSARELRYVRPGQDVVVEFRNGDEMRGVLGNISQTADALLMYRAEVQVEEPVSLLGEIVRVRLPIELDHPLIPLNVVRLVNAQLGELALYRDGEVVYEQLRLGQVWGSLVEVLDPLPANSLIITTPLRTYTPERFDLVIGS